MNRKQMEIENIFGTELLNNMVGRYTELKDFNFATTRSLDVVRDEFIGPNIVAIEENCNQEMDVDYLRYVFEYYTMQLKK